MERWSNKEGVSHSRLELLKDSRVVVLQGRREVADPETKAAPN